MSILDLIGPALKVPAAATPWRANGHDVYDGNDYFLFNFEGSCSMEHEDKIKVAKLIVELVNARASFKDAAPAVDEPTLREDLDPKDVDHYVDRDGDPWFVFGDRAVNATDREDATRIWGTSMPEEFLTIEAARGKYGPLKPVYAE